MMLSIFICGILVAASVSARTPPLSAVTFKNVTVSGYSLFTWKFNVTIQSSNSLKEHIPKVPYDRLDIIGDVPILRQNAITDLDNLDELIVQFNILKDIQPGAFREVSQLRKLTITDNNLEQIKKGVFNNLNIATLDLSRNQIATVDPAAFDDMPELLAIKLADNKISQLNRDWFTRTPLLSTVSLQNNLIETIPPNAFNNLKGDKKFGSVSLTVHIVLSHNKIKKIDPEAFRGLTKIKNLWLDNNQIDQWTGDLLSNVQVEHLRLNQNKLTCLGEDLNKVFTAETTHIDGNPWDCGCLKNIDAWAKSNSKDVQMFYSNLQCDAQRIEKKMKNLEVLLQELKKKDLEIENNIGDVAKQINSL